MWRFCSSSLSQTLKYTSKWLSTKAKWHTEPFSPLPFPPINLFFRQILVVWVVLWTLFSIFQQCWQSYTLLCVCLILASHAKASCHCFSAFFDCFPSDSFHFTGTFYDPKCLKKGCADSSSHISLEHEEFRVLILGRLEHRYSIFP